MKRVFIPLTIVIIFAVLVSLSWWHQHQLDARYSAGNYSYGIPIRSQSLEEMAQKRRKVYLTRAFAAREQYRQWVTDHKEVIAKIATTSANDKMGIIGLFNELPHNPTEAGIALLSDPIHSIDDSKDPSKYLFSWQIPHVAKLNDEYLPSAAKALRNYKDIPLSYSTSSAGGESIVLWASGRVTEMKFIPNPVKTKGSIALIEQQTELASSFSLR